MFASKRSGMTGGVHKREEALIFLLFQTESELSTVSKENGEGGSLLKSFMVWLFSSMSWAPPFLSLPFALCPLHLNFPASLPTLFLTPCVWFPLEQSVSKCKTYWLLLLGLPTDLCAQKLSKPDID